MHGVIPPLLQYVFIALCLVNSRDNFNFTFYLLLFTNLIPNELVQAGSRTQNSKIHKFIVSILNKKELAHPWKEPVLSLFTKCKTKLAAVISEEFLFCQLQTNLYHYSLGTINTLKMGAVMSSKTPVSYHNTRQHQSSEDINLK
jgi:hypothetical protein